MISRLTEAVRRRFARRQYLRTSGWPEFVERLDREVLNGGASLSDGEKRELFRKHVQLVELEPHAFCNRTCSFCPNSFLDRRSPKDALDLELYQRILGELQHIHYAGVLRFARYSEPMAFDHIYGMVATAREALPSAEIDLISNGDYLRPERVERLRKAGLDVLRISIYLQGGSEWTEEAARVETATSMQRAGLGLRALNSSPTSVIGRGRFGTMRVTSTCHDFARVGVDRGKSLPHLTTDGYIRNSPCRFVFENFTVDYNGIVMPCCNLRSDDPDHRLYQIGNLSDGASIFDIYCSGALAKWRSELIAVGAKRGVCSSCTQKDVPSSSIPDIERIIRRKLGRIESESDGRSSGPAG